MKWLQNFYNQPQAFPRAPQSLFIIILTGWPISPPGCFQVPQLEYVQNNFWVSHKILYFPKRSSYETAKPHTQLHKPNAEKSLTSSLSPCPNYSISLAGCSFKIQPLSPISSIITLAELNIFCCLNYWDRYEMSPLHLLWPSSVNSPSSQNKLKNTKLGLEIILKNSISSPLTFKI